MLVECMGICVVSMAHESELGGFPVHVYIVKIDLDFFFFAFIFSQGACPWMVSASKFFWVFFSFFGEGLCVKFFVGII